MKILSFAILSATGLVVTAFALRFIDQVAGCVFALLFAVRVLVATDEDLGK
jgi:hypothetical protein